ncbi:hypothetical protein B0J17DRAFT_627132 [Rhizoctonia solani]|nr:hypothetical protein B0J17DRAFT_627132 [Rhizoctonia solani]
MCRLEAVAVCCAQCIILSQHCEELAIKLREKEGTMDKTRFEEATVDLAEVLHKTCEFNNTLNIPGLFAGQSPYRWCIYGFSHAQEEKQRLSRDRTVEGAFYGRKLAFYVEMKTISEREIRHQHNRMNTGQQDNQSELNDMLHAQLQAQNEEIVGLERTDYMYRQTGLDATF